MTAILKLFTIIQKFEVFNLILLFNEDALDRSKVSVKT